MPYASVDDLPASVRAHLPPHAQEIYLAAFNRAWIDYQDRGERREEIAHRVAWAAVKRKYRKTGDRWISLQPDRSDDVRIIACNALLSEDRSTSESSLPAKWSRPACITEVATTWQSNARGEPLCLALGLDCVALWNARPVADAIPQSTHDILARNDADQTLIRTENRNAAKPMLDHQLKHAHQLRG